MANEKILELANITKRFGEVTAVHDLSIPFINRGEFVTFLGPSGCGKTTLLRLVAGFYYPTAGQIIMHGERINDIPPEKRKTCMVFQNYALFPHMSVYENIAYGLKLRRQPREEIRRKVSRILEVVRLEGLGHRRPSELSGGQQQRVALARCIVIEPEIILLDEPLSNLDASLRVSMREQIRKIQQSLNLTVIFVTHDQEEAMSMSDRIVVLNRGQVEQIGTPVEIYEKSRSLFTACFIGCINLIEGRILQNSSGRLCVRTALGQFTNRNEELSGLVCGAEVTVIIRPEAACLAEEPRSTAGQALPPNGFRGKIESCLYLGSLVRYRITAPGLKQPFVLDASNPGGKGIRSIGEEVTVRIPESVHCLRR